MFYTVLDDLFITIGKYKTVGMTSAFVKKTRYIVKKTIN